MGNHWYQGINDLINRKTKNTKVIMKMKHSQTQEISHDPLVNANILNSHFASVGNRLASELPNSGAPPAREARASGRSSIAKEMW